MHISWHYDGPPSEAVEFVIQYKAKQLAAHSGDYSEIVGLKTNYYTVQHLGPFTEYEFVVLAVSAIGRGLPSTATFVTTGETGNSKTLISPILSTYYPSNCPSKFSIVHINFSCIIIWQKGIFIWRYNQRHLSVAPAASHFRILLTIKSNLNTILLKLLIFHIMLLYNILVKMNIYVANAIYW